MTSARPRRQRGNPTAYDAILVAGFGGPEGLDDVMPFLRNVTRGRGVPDERLADVAGHYLALGGVSPINEHNRALVAALQSELGARGFDIPVLWGNRNWSPYLVETLRAAHASGFSSLLAIATSAYSSYSSCRQYREDFASALIDSGLVGEMRIDKLRPFYDLPGFLEAFTAGITESLSRAADAGVAANEVTVVFTTHSIPEVMADSSGTAGDGQLYVAQHLAACEAVMHAVVAELGAASDAPPSWRLAYQSRSGSPHTPWLEPDVNAVIAEIAKGGGRGVVVVPIGFVSDHVEVIWDLDTEAAQTAAEHGLWFERVATPGTQPAFVASLADLIVERLAEVDVATVAGPRIGSATALPARPDTCPPGCCRGRALRPTTAGADSAADWRATPFDPAQLAASGIPDEAFAS